MTTKTKKPLLDPRAFIAGANALAVDNINPPLAHKESEPTPTAVVPASQVVASPNVDVQSEVIQEPKPVDTAANSAPISTKAPWEEVDDSGKIKAMNYLMLPSMAVKLAWLVENLPKHRAGSLQKTIHAGVEKHVNALLDEFYYKK